METCPMCRMGTMESLVVDRAFQVETRWIVIRQVPALVCDTCGETTFPETSVGRVQAIIQGSELPVASSWTREYAFDPAGGRPAPSPLSTAIETLVLSVSTHMEPILVG